jgi:DNA end-binding protein Ku
MPKAVWTGTLSFGLVTIPVRLFPATEPRDVRFHLTDERGRRVRYRPFVDREAPPDWEGSPVPEATSEPGVPGEPSGMRVGTAAAPPDETAEADADETEVEYGDLMRGFETDDGRVVLMSRDEIEGARPERSRTIEIEDFVELADIDPVYFEKSYVVAPQGGAEKPYALLLRAIEGSGRVGIGRFVLRTKPHLVAIRPGDGVLALETLFFGDEVRDGRALAPGVDAIEVSDRELSLATTLIDTLKTAWNPAAYADTYREELLRRIAEKTPIEADETAEAGGAPTRRAEELMEALRASVEAAKKAKGTRSRTRRREGRREDQALARRRKWRYPHSSCGTYASSITVSPSAATQSRTRSRPG